jgi:hypothetical protein
MFRQLTSIWGDARDIVVTTLVADVSRPRPVLLTFVRLLARGPQSPKQDEGESK